MNWLTPAVMHLLWRGLVLTLMLTFLTSLAAMALGVAVGVARLSERGLVRKTAVLYVEIHRNVPALVHIIFWAFALPNVFPAGMRQGIFFNNLIINWLGDMTGLTVPYYALAAGFGLTLNTSAYLAELFRAGVGTIPREHLDAARSLGASKLVVLRTVLIPEGVRASFPAMSTRLIHNMKNTALASFVAVPEFFLGVQAAITRSFRAVEYLLLASVVYLILSYGMSLLLNLIERWLLGRRVSAVFAEKKGWQIGRV